MHQHHTSRRRFLHRSGAAAAAAAGALGAKSLTARAGEPAKGRAKGRIVDVHTHLGQTWNNKPELTAKGLLEWMDAHDVAQAVVLPLVSPESSSYLLTSDFVLEQTKPHRDRLIPFCCVDPRTSYTGGRHGLKYMLRRWVDAGARGFGEHKPAVAIDDPRSHDLYAVCGELKLPVLFHLDEQRNTDVPGLPGLAKVLKAHPQTNFIGHGPGWWVSIAGDVTAAQLAGYPKGNVASGGAMDRLMDAYANVFSDLSAGSGAGALLRDLAFARAFVARRQERLMFGSDYLSPGQSVPQFELFEKLALPPEIEAKVLRDNARRVIGID